MLGHEEAVARTLAFLAALSHITGKPVPADLWIECRWHPNHAKRSVAVHDPLQNWVGANCPQWMSAIGVIEAAELLVETAIEVDADEFFKRFKGNLEHNKSSYIGYGTGDVMADGVKGDAKLSYCGRYRYLLSRTWDEKKPVLNWIMLNPSTADARVDDPTIRKCMGFARRGGFGAITVTNLFAYRATDPKDLLAIARDSSLFGAKKRNMDVWDITGDPDNLDFIVDSVRRAKLTVFAWGAHGILGSRDEKIRSLLTARKLLHKTTVLAFSKAGFPGHPLYLPYELMDTLMLSIKEKEV